MLIVNSNEFPSLDDLSPILSKEGALLTWATLTSISSWSVPLGCPSSARIKILYDPEFGKTGEKINFIASVKDSVVIQDGKFPPLYEAVIFKLPVSSLSWSVAATINSNLSPSLIDTKSFFSRTGGLFVLFIVSKYSTRVDPEEFVDCNLTGYSPAESKSRNPERA